MVRILIPSDDTSQAELACDHEDLCSIGVIEKQAANTDPNMLAMLFNQLIAPLLREQGRKQYETALAEWKATNAAALGRGEKVPGEPTAGQYGYTSIPMIGGSSNLYERLRSQSASNDFLSAMQNSAQLDQPTYVAMARGLLDLTNRQKTPISEEAVSSLAGQIAEMSPYLSMIMPELWDRLHGDRGSVSSLSSALMRNSRWTGMTPESATNISTGIMDAYRSDPDQFSGLSAYEIGDLYQEMRAQGMISHDSPGIVQSLANMSAPVAAVRDLGIPGGLAAVSALMPRGAGLNWIDPQDMAHRIRTNANVARRGGYGLTDRPTYEGAMSTGQWDKRDALQRQMASQSPAANRLGASFRLGEVLGFTVENPEQIVTMSDRDWSRWIHQKSGGRVNRNQAYSALHSYGANQAAAFSANSEAVVRNLQGWEAGKTIDRYLGRRGHGGVGSFIMGMDPQVAANQALRNRALQNKFRISPMEAETLWTDIDDTFLRRHNMSLLNMHSLHSTSQVGYMKNTRQVAEDEARLQAKSTGAYNPDWLRRASQALQEGGNPLAEAAGFLPTKEFEKLFPNFNELFPALSGKSEGKKDDDKPKPDPAAPRLPVPPTPPGVTTKSSSDMASIGRIIKLALNKMGLDLDESKIQGIGLFAEDSFKKGEYIALGATRKKKDQDLDEYALTIAARFSNHSLRPNTELRQEGDKLKIHAKSNIKPGDELTADYFQVNALMGPGSRMTWRGKAVPAKDFSKYSEEVAMAQKTGAGDISNPRVRFVLPYEDQHLLQMAISPEWKGWMRHAGGGIEKDETPEEAAIREFEEEFGKKLNPEQLKYLGVDPRDEFSKHRFYEVLDHGLSPDTYQASNDPDEVIKLVKSLMAGDKYLGPNMAKLSEDTVISQLLKAKAESDRKNYAAKHDILSKLIKKHPDEFVIDSDKGKFYGIKHVPSGFKIHMPRVSIPSELALSLSQDDVYVQSAVPAASRDLVKKHGLLSSQALLNNPEALKGFLGDRVGTEWEEDEEAFKKRIEEKLKDAFWGDSMKGPSVFFGDPDPEKITDAHPMRKLKSEMLRVNLSKLLRDHPKTRIAGTELKPYDPEGPEIQGDLRHYDIDLDKVREYAATDPKELWKHYNDPEGVRYAGNVPHAQIITPSGGIPPEYLS